ncbi:MAG: hypothetical protein ACP5T0_08760 [Verrucomicrobiia bacterium]
MRTTNEEKIRKKLKQVETIAFNAMLLLEQAEKQARRGNINAFIACHKNSQLFLRRIVEVLTEK